MAVDNFEDITKRFSQIDIEDEPGSEKYDIYSQHLWDIDSKPQPTLRCIPAKYVDFELYVKENCHNRIQILNRETFHQIQRPIIIFFNHFRVKCGYHTEWLDRMQELAFKYGDRIELIAADMIDKDVLYPGTNPINLFCRLVRPEADFPSIYAIDEKKRIYKQFDAHNTLEHLSELCENLLNGKLFPSLPIPENNDTNLVKICVELNHEELILKSGKNIFLIVNLERYQHSEYEPKYENVALALRDYNLDIVYMEAEKNYVPFEYHVSYYPTLLFIPYNDKKNFIYYEGFRKEEDIIEFLKEIMEQPSVLLLKQRELQNKVLKKTLQVANDFQIDFSDLTQFFEDHFDNKFKVLDRQVLKTSKRYFIIIFMDFPIMKCLAEHVKWLNQIYQVAEGWYSLQFFIADFKDIDVINTKWKAADLIKSAQGKPKIYGYDYLKHTYAYDDSIESLFYFTTSLQYGHFYYSQVYPRENLLEAVKLWTADYFQIFLQKCKKHIFITFYSTEDEQAEQLLNMLDNIAAVVKDLNVEVAKFDVKLNYVGLEYAQDSYPVHYFIPKHNKSDSRLYRDCELRRDKMLEFIYKNVVEK